LLSVVLLAAGTAGVEARTTTGDAVAKPAVNLPLGIPVLRGLPALAAPGDYLLTISGVTGPAGVAKVEQHVLLNDLGRVADFHPSARPQTVTAEVRVTSLLDSFDLWSAAGRISAGLMTLTPASFSYLVRGAHLTTPNASDVVLHGINAMNTTSPPRVADMITDYPSDAIARVGIDEQCWDPFFTAAQRAKVCNAFNTAAAIGAPAYRTWMLSIVHAVLGTGRPVILDVINSGRDDPSFSSTDLPDVVAPDQHTLGVYDDLVRSFANNPQVIFETFNEPKVVPAVEYAPDGLTGATLWRDGGRIQIDGITWTAPGVQTIVDRIRAHGAKNLIMVQGTQWGADLTPTPTTRATRSSRTRWMPVSRHCSPPRTATSAS
jgi:hypothetical protein